MSVKVHLEGEASSELQELASSFLRDIAGVDPEVRTVTETRGAQKGWGEAAVVFGLILAVPAALENTAKLIDRVRFNSGLARLRDGLRRTNAIARIEIESQSLDLADASPDDLYDRLFGSPPGR